jgi:hypothetical protein
MRWLKRIAALIGLCAMAALSGCAGSTGPDYPLQCIFDLNPVGAYTYPAGIAVPTVVPAEGGTQEGADALNACIRTRAAAAGAAPASPEPTSAGAPQQNTIQTNGPVTTRVFTYGSPPPDARFVAPTQAAVPSAPRSGGSSQQSTVRTDGGVVTETDADGTPPAARLSSVPTQAVAPSSSSSIAAPRPCSLEMTGGSGYTCAP